MSEIEIKANLNQSERVFAYTGADILGPLRSLHSRLVSDVEATRAKLDPDDRALPALSDLRGNDPAAQAKHKIKLLLSEAFRAQLWAREAERSPKEVYKLTFSELQWLYQYDAPK